MPRTNAHFRTKRPGFRLAASLLASLAMHGVTVLPGIDIGKSSRPAAPPPLTAELRPPPATAAEAPPLRLAEPPPKPAAPTPAKKVAPSKPPAPADWTQTIRQHLKRLDAAGQFYPAEAIARGLQGEATVLIVLDETGKVVAARIEASSGHAILDDAALRAVRSLASLPAEAPRQVLLPVRFRLH